MIHNSSVIDKKAKVSQSVKIGPFCYVGPEVELSDGVELVSNVHIEGNTKIGKGTKIFPFASIGTQPQDLKFEAMLQTIEEQRMAEAKAKLEEEEIQLASLSNRLIAAVIDGIFSIAIFLVLFFSSLALGGLSEVVSNIILIASLVVWFILHLGIEVWFGGLPGKLLLGMKVKTEDFQQITFKQAYHRFIYKISSLFVIFSVIGALRRDDRMLRHDEITQTRVFKV